MRIHELWATGLVLALSGLGVGADAPHWGYTGPMGPAQWSKLSKEFATCAVGKTQSPIDIPDAKATRGDLPPILFDYKPSPLRIIDNGHTIQVNYAAGSSIAVAGRRSELVQFHFHKPSEEKIDGKSHDMVVHLVHKDKDGNLAVVAVLLDRGAENPLVKTLWGNLPRSKEEEVAVSGVEIDASRLLPQDRGYYTFMGSLTTPPCSENVTWFVLKAPMNISNEEIARFAQLYPTNARPPQPLNGREIQASR
jgi:carbonic anhydrase